MNLQMKTIAVILIRTGFFTEFLPVYLNVLDLISIVKVKIPFILPIEKHILMVL